MAEQDASATLSITFVPLFLFTPSEKVAMRINVVREVIHTEKDYVEDMEIMMQVAPLLSLPFSELTRVDIFAPTGA